MSVCPSKDLYSAYVDDELPKVWKEKLEAHAEVCLKCKKVMDSYKNLKKSLNAQPFIYPDLDRSFQKLCKKHEAYYETRKEKKRLPVWLTKSVKVPVPLFFAAALLLAFTPVILFRTDTQGNHICDKAVHFKPILPVMHSVKKRKLNLNDEVNFINKDVFNNFDGRAKYAQTIDGIAASFSEFVHLYLPQAENKDNNIIIIGLPYSGANGVYYNFSGVYDSDLYEFLNNVK